MNIFRLAGDSPHERPRLAPQDPHHQIMCRCFVEDSGAVCDCFRNPLLGYLHGFHILLQYCYETDILGELVFNCLVKLVRRSYDKDQDTFRHWFLVLPCLVLALIINEKFSFREVMWTFSLFLEAVAILPQLVLMDL